LPTHPVPVKKGEEFNPADNPKITVKNEDLGSKKHIQ